MQVQQLFCEDLDELGVVHEKQVLQRFEVYVVCGVYGLRCAEDGVCDGDAAAEEGGVFYVVDTIRMSVSRSPCSLVSTKIPFNQRTATTQYVACLPPLL
jgi:hypothetical protein